MPRKSESRCQLQIIDKNKNSCCKLAYVIANQPQVVQPAIQLNTRKKLSLNLGLVASSKDSLYATKRVTITQKRLNKTTFTLLSSKYSISNAYLTVLVKEAYSGNPLCVASGYLPSVEEDFSSPQFEELAERSQWSTVEGCHVNAYVTLLFGATATSSHSLFSQLNM